MTLQKSIKLLYDQRAQIINNSYWPVDDRVNIKLFAGLMDARWYSHGLSSAGSKRRASPDQSGELVSEPVASLNSQESSSWESSQGRSQSSVSSWMFSTQETPYGSQTSTSTMAAPEYTGAPPAKKRKTLRGTKFQPGLGQKICVWNGVCSSSLSTYWYLTLSLFFQLLLPGPMARAKGPSGHTPRGLPLNPWA